jgi:hypothetical protein
VNDFMTAQMEATMSTIPLNPKDTAVLFVEPQDAWLPMSRTVEPARLRAAWIWLVKLARLFELPIVLSTASLEVQRRASRQSSKRRRVLTATSATGEALRI